MIRIDLITGFLGAGKTTFIKEYASFLVRSGEKVCIIENDYGAVNVDMVLLKDLLSDKCNLEMLVGGDGRDAHRRRFRTKLISMAMSGFTRVIIEPSGVYDVDEFFDALYDEPLDKWYEVGSVIAIVDGASHLQMSDTSRYLLMSEVSWAGKILISKLNSYGKGPERERAADLTKDFIGRCMKDFGCNISFTADDFITRDLTAWEDDDFRKVRDAGYRQASFVKLPVNERDFTSLFYFDVEMPKALLNEKINGLFEDKKAGKIIRIKGSASVTDKGVTSNDSKTEKPANTSVDDKYQLEINATPEDISMKRAVCTRDILIIIGENLDKEYINGIFRDYCSVVSL